jgi:hypothetical protein
VEQLTDILIVLKAMPESAFTWFKEHPCNDIDNIRPVSNCQEVANLMTYPLVKDLLML